MAKHKIEIKHECQSCGGTGLYVGLGERNGAAVVCHTCGGTGEAVKVFEYEDFSGRKKRRGVKPVYEVNPGICIGARKGVCSLSDFGGMTYEDWLKGKKFEVGMENRKYTCPAWWYQTADYDKKPKWQGCLSCGSFSGCKRFKEAVLGEVGQAVRRQENALTVLELAKGIEPPTT